MGCGASAGRDVGRGDQIDVRSVGRTSSKKRHADGCESAALNANGGGGGGSLGARGEVLHRRYTPQAVGLPVGGSGSHPLPYLDPERVETPDDNEDVHVAGNGNDAHDDDGDNCSEANVLEFESLSSSMSVEESDPRLMASFSVTVAKISGHDSHGLTDGGSVSMNTAGHSSKDASSGGTSSSVNGFFQAQQSMQQSWSRHQVA